MNARRASKVTRCLGWGLGAIALIQLPACRLGGIGQNAVGVQMYQQGRYAEALQQFEAAKQTDPANPDTYYNLGSTYHRLGMAQKDQKLLDQAEALYNQALDLSPNHTDSYRGLAVLLAETNRSDKAFTLLKKWNERSPQLADPKVELAKLHQEFQQSSAAEQLLDEALAIHPHHAAAWAARGRLRESAGDLAQARQNYLQSLTINSLQPEVYQRVAALDVRLGQNAIQNAVTAAQTTIANGMGAPQSTLTPAPAASGAAPVVRY